MSEYPGETVYRDALALTRRDLGRILLDENRLPDFERELKEAAALWDDLARAQPEFAGYRSRLADVHGRLGDQYQRQGRVDEAEASFRRALDIADRLAREHAEVDAYQESLATILQTFAALKANKLHDRPGCTALVDRAVGIMEKLAGDHPEVTRYQLGLGLKLASLGHSFAQEEKFPQAEAAVKRCVAILEKLAADHPQDVQIAEALGKSYWRMQMILVLRGDARSALEWAGRRIHLFRSLARGDPRNRRIGRIELWGALAERAETWTRLGRLTEALVDFKEAIELAHDNGNKEEELLRVLHGLTGARLGDLSELALLGDQVPDVVKAGAGQGGETIYNYWMFNYDAACVHAALAELAVQDWRRPPPERRRLADRNLERALELLEKARSSGEFKETVHLDEIRRERLLDPLRSYPRFGP